MPRTGFANALPPFALRLEFLDYPGEWLLDLPLLRQSYSAWSEQVLRRLEGRAEAAEFLAFATGAAGDGAGADEALAATGHRLYRRLLQRLRDAGLALLQPGRFLMPAPGAEPAWMAFFPIAAAAGCTTCWRGGTTPRGGGAARSCRTRCSASSTAWWCWSTCSRRCTRARPRSPT